MAFGLRIRGDIACRPAQASFPAMRTCCCNCLLNWFLLTNKFIFVGRVKFSKFIRSSVLTTLIWCQHNCVCGSFELHLCSLLSNSLCIVLWPHCSHWYLIQFCAWPVCNKSVIFLQASFMRPCFFLFRNYGNFWLLLLIFDNFWEVLATFINFWKLLAIFCNLS